ncbi:putative Phox domain, PX domain superfamily protein [Plasmopara halstedii]
MRESLPRTRMSMSVLNQENPNGRELRLWLLSASTHHGVTYYRIAGRFTSSGQTWEVSHRYSEFLKLRDQLVKFLSSSTEKCPGCHNYLHSIQRFSFPKKHLFASRAPPVVNYRVKALRSFINLLASWAFSKTPKCPTCGGYAFEVVRNFVLEGDDLSADTNMNSIRQSMAVEVFAEQNVSSSRGQKNSWAQSPMNPDITQSMYAQPRDLDLTSSGASPLYSREKRPTTDRQSLLRSASQQSRTTHQHQALIEQRRQQELDPYDAFNDYLPQKQSKVRRPSQQNMEQKIQNGKFSSRPLQESIEDKKQRRVREQDEVNALQQKLVKHRSEPQLSAQSELSEVTSAFQRQLSSEDAVSSDMVSTEGFLANEGVIITESIDEKSTGSVCSDDDELELTGVVMASPLARKKGTTDDMLELARVA